ncbi:alpha-amylase [Nesidiocoris tenuis]|nr:alpha-amylase [Nesidiocoris tenuis]
MVSGTHSAERLVQLFEWRFDDIARECRGLSRQEWLHGSSGSHRSQNVLCLVVDHDETVPPFSYKIISRSGVSIHSKACDRCSKVGVGIIVDVLLNHMSTNTPLGTVGTGGAIPTPTNKSYPAVPYTAEHFHPTCQITDYNNATNVRVCELVLLHDLNQTQEYVRGKLVDHLNHLVDLGATGFRIDAAKHMYPEDIQIILKRVKKPSNGKNLFIFQEVPDDTGPEAIKAEEYFDIGLVTEFKFASGIKNHIANLSSLKDFGKDLMDSKHAVIFTDNHDRQRDFPFNYKIPSIYKLANAFMLGWSYGHSKKVMSSYQFTTTDDGPPHNDDMSIKNVTISSEGVCGNGWICEHRWPEIAAMVRFAKAVEGSGSSDFVAHSPNTISFQRTGKGFVLLSADNPPKNLTNVQTGLKRGIYCDIITNPGPTGNCTSTKIEVNSEGKANFSFPLNSPNNYTIIAIHLTGGVSAVNCSALVLMLSSFLVTILAERHRC